MRVIEGTRLVAAGIRTREGVLVDNKKGLAARVLRNREIILCL
jgi:hypothetical protein